MDGRITTVLGGDPAIVTVDFADGVEPSEGCWLMLEQSRFRVLSYRKLKSGSNRWKLRCERIPPPGARVLRVSPPRRVGRK